MSETTPTTSPISDKLVFSFYLPSFIGAFSLALLFPVLPIYAEGFTLSLVFIGLILAADGFGQLIGDIPAGALLNRIDRKNVMLFGVLLVALCIALLFWIQNIALLLLVRVFTGIGMAFFNIARYSYIREQSQNQNRGKSIASLGGVVRIGSFAGPAIGGLLAATFGLRVPFMFAAAIMVLAFIFILVFVSKKPTKSLSTHQTAIYQTAKTYASPLAAFTNLAKTLRENRHILLGGPGFGQLFAQMIRNGRNIVIPLYGSQVLGLEVESVGYIMSLASGIDMSLFIPAGIIMDRFGRKFAIVPSFIIQGFSMILVGFSTGFGSLLFATCLMGFGNGISSGSMMTIGADLAPEDLEGKGQGEFLGAWRFLGDAGQTGAPLVVGFVAQALSLNLAAFVIAAVGFGSAYIFTKHVPETLQRKTTPQKTS